MAGSVGVCVCEGWLMMVTRKDLLAGVAEVIDVCKSLWFTTRVTPSRGLAALHVCNQDRAV